MSFEGSVTRNEAVYFVWGLGYTKQASWCRLGMQLCKTKLVASFGGLVTRNGPVGCSATHLVGLPILGSPLGSC